MVGHRSRAAFAAVVTGSLALLLLAPAGVASAQQADPQFHGSWFTLSGGAVGSEGSIDGSTVTACPLFGPGGQDADPSFGGMCASGSVSGGSYAIDGLHAGNYVVSINTPSPYPDGYYAEGSSGNFSTSRSAATVVEVLSDVGLGTMVVPIGSPLPPPPPPSTGSISGQVLAAQGWPAHGGTVTACPSGWDPNPWPWPWPWTPGAPVDGTDYGTNWGCRSASIDSHGFFTVGGLRQGSYTVAINANAGAMPFDGAMTVDGQGSSLTWWWNPAGWYSAGSPGNFSTSASMATPVWVWGPVWLPTIVLNWGWNPTPTSATVSGFAYGVTTGALAGGTVSACNTNTWNCTQAAIQSTGAYSFGSLANGTYRIAVAPPAGANYPSGYLATGQTGNFSTNVALTTFITVAGSAVSVPTMTVPLNVVVVVVPPNVGGTNTGPATVVVVSYARLFDSLATTPSVIVRKGVTTEVIACVGRNLAGTTVEVWRKLPGQSWMFLTTRRVSVSGCSRFIFTPTKSAAYRFRVPGSTMNIAVWGPSRSVIVVQ